MRALGLCLCLVMWMGLSCDTPVEVTVEVQYVNNTGSNIRFDVHDAANTNLGSYSMEARDFTNSADPVSTITGILPLTVTTPFYANDPTLNCVFPQTFGLGDSSYSQLTALVKDKIVRIEATAGGTLECVPENK